MLPLSAGIFTFALTNSSITLTESDGVRGITIFNSSATTGTVLGTQKLGALSSTAIDIAEDVTFAQTGIGSAVIKDLVITAPAGCTLEIVAQI